MYYKNDPQVTGLLITRGYSTDNKQQREFSISFYPLAGNK
jgi:hypothetical protein